MEDPFEGVTPAKKDESADIAQIRSLTDEFVFCPKCGHKNTFELSKTGAQLVYFCKRCSAKLNDYWVSHQNDAIVIANCKSCHQATFKELKYCISCGLQQKAVAAKRSRKLSQMTRDTDLAEGALVEATSCCYLGPCDSCFAFLITKTLRRLPRICTYICAVISLALFAFIIALIVMISRDL